MKTNLPCPNCGQETIKRSTKFWMGPARSTVCSHCHANISIPITSLFILTLFMFLILTLSTSITSGYIWLIGVIVLTVLYSIAFYYLVPLQTKYTKEKPMTKSLKDPPIAAVPIPKKIAKQIPRKISQPTWMYGLTFVLPLALLAFSQAFRQSAIAVLASSLRLTSLKSAA